jgi:DDE superfamily endonuclease
LGSGGSLADIHPKFFLNMDQTAVFFESKSDRVVSKRGKKSISQRDSGSDSKRATVVVTVASDGTILDPFFIFKGKAGKRLEQSMASEGVKGCCQKKGWFDEIAASKWIDQILEPYVRHSENALLLVDHYSVHCTSSFVTKCNKLGIELEYIPKGYTCVLQPVDVGFNLQ